MRARLALGLAAFLCLLVSPLGTASAEAGYVTSEGANFRHEGQPWKFGGTNNYELMYASRAGVDRILQSAAQNNLKVVRMWAFFNVYDPSNTGLWTHGDTKACEQGGYVHLQRWNGSAPQVNPGPCGLERLDYVLDKARQLGLKLTLVLNNNWREFGGVDQYIRWRYYPNEQNAHHEDFFTDPTIKSWFKTYMDTLANRSNTINGRVYRNDDTIFSWELMNEPRCSHQGGYNFGATAACTPQLITDWAREMSDYLASRDPNHLISAGDEGFYCRGGSDHFYNCGEKVDTMALTALPNIDYMSYHNYAGDGWSRDQAWGRQWVSDHVRDARSLTKPSVMGEFGWGADGAAPGVFHDWLTTLENEGGNGWNNWMLCDPSGGDCDGSHGERCSGAGSGTSGCSELYQHATWMLQNPGDTGGGGSPPPAPSVTATDPASPANDNSPEVRGSAATGATVTLYTTSDCSGSPVATGTAAGFASPGLTVSVADNSTTTFRAKASNAAGSSPCSASAITYVESTPSPPPANGIVDELNDFSKVNGRSTNTTIDTTNVSFMHGDPARATRTSTAAANVRYRVDGISHVRFVTYHWPGETLRHFVLQTSPNGSAWTTRTPIRHDAGGDWRKVVYSYTPPSGTNYLRIQFPAGDANSWARQLGRVEIDGPGLLDNMTGFGLMSSRSANLAFDTSNTAMFEGDTSRLNRSANSAEWIAYNRPNTSYVKVVGYHWPYEAVQHLRFYTSPNGTSWTQRIPTVTDQGGDWRRLVYELGPPAGTSYVKVEFPIGQNNWTPQISQVLLR